MLITDKRTLEELMNLIDRCNFILRIATLIANYFLGIARFWDRTRVWGERVCCAYVYVLERLVIVIALFFKY